MSNVVSLFLSLCVYHFYFIFVGKKYVLLFELVAISSDIYAHFRVCWFTGAFCLSTAQACTYTHMTAD